MKKTIIFIMVLVILSMFTMGFYQGFYGNNRNPFSADSDAMTNSVLWGAHDSGTPTGATQYTYRINIDYTTDFISFSNDPDGTQQYFPLIQDFDNDGIREIFLFYDNALHMINAETNIEEANFPFTPFIQSNPATFQFLDNDRYQILLITSNESTETGTGNFTVIDYNGSVISINWTYTLDEGINTTRDETPTHPIVCKAGFNVSGVKNCYVQTNDNQIFGFNATSTVTNQPSFYTALSQYGTNALTRPSKTSAPIFSEWGYTGELQRMALFIVTNENNLNITLVSGDGVIDMTHSIGTTSQYESIFMNAIDWTGGVDKEIIVIQSLAWMGGSGSSDVSIIDYLGNNKGTKNIDPSTNPIVKDWDNDEDDKQEFAVFTIDQGVEKYITFEVYESVLGSITKKCDAPIIDTDGTLLQFIDIVGTTMTSQFANPQTFHFVGIDNGLDYMTIMNRIIRINTTGWNGGSCGSDINVTVVQDFPITCTDECGWIIPYSDGRDDMVDFIQMSGDTAKGFYIHNSNYTAPQTLPSNLEICWDTSQPFCFNTSVKFTAIYTDAEEDLAQLSIQCTDETFIDWSITSAQPSANCRYNKTGTFNSHFYLTDDLDDQATNISRSILFTVISGGCFEGGQKALNDFTCTSEQALNIIIGGLGEVDVFGINRTNLGFDDTIERLDGYTSKYYNASGCSSTGFLSIFQSFCPIRSMAVSSMTGVSTFFLNNLFLFIILLIFIFGVAIISTRRS